MTNTADKNFKDNKIFQKIKYKESSDTHEFWECFEHIIFHNSNYDKDEFSNITDWNSIQWYYVQAAIQHKKGASIEEYDSNIPNFSYMETSRLTLIKMFPDKLNNDGDPFGIPNPETL